MTHRPVLPHPSPPDQDARPQAGVVLKCRLTTPPSPAEVTILLAEDEPTVRDMITRVLRREGYQIIGAGDGVEAIHLLELQPRLAVHLLITDLDMPRLGGADLATRLHAERRVQRVIYMTGDIFRPPPLIDLASDMLRKPFNLQRLTSSVQALLAR